MSRKTTLYRFLTTLCCSSKLPWLLALTAAVVMLPSLGSGFMEDDHMTVMRLKKLDNLPAIQGHHLLDMHTTADGRPENTRTFMEEGRFPWWTADGYKHAMFRPLSAVTHYVDWYLFGHRAWPMHAHNIVMYAISVFVLVMLYRRFLSPAWVVGLAGLMYAIDASHAGAVGWISARNAPLPAIFIIFVLYFHDRWRRDGWKPGLWAALGSLILGLLASEGAVASGAYLAGHALFLDKGPLARRFGRLLPYLAVVVVWRVIYVSLGYGVSDSLLYTDPLGQPGRFVGNLAHHLPTLLFFLLFGGEPGVVTFVPAPWNTLLLAVTVAGVCVVTWAIWPLLKRNAVARFWALGMVLSIVPMSSSFPQGRELMNPGIGAFALIALFIQHQLAQKQLASEAGRRPVRLAGALAAVWLIMHVWVSLVTAPLTAYTASRAPALIEGQLNETAPSDDGFSTLVCAYLPGDVLTYVLPIMRHAHGGRVPPFGRTLCAGVQEVEFERTDERSLVMRVDDTFLTPPYSQAFRNPFTAPMREGQIVELTGFEAEVLDVTPDGRPREVTFTFDVPLEDPSLRWVTYDNERGGYKAFAVPAIGQTVVLSAPTFDELARMWFLNQ